MENTFAFAIYYSIKTSQTHFDGNFRGFTATSPDTRHAGNP